MKEFSFFNRTKIKEKLAKTSYDLIIIGGGITGAGIALDAVSRGMKVALVEKNDFAAGTSSKSTKLIHGGLRYLKQLHFRMVADVGRERRIVHELAPHLVLPEKMLLPILKGSSMGKFSISLGLKFYDMLAGVKGNDQRKMLNKKETLKAEPLLPADLVTSGGLYAEYRTDDARLTIEIIKTAYSRGADILNYVKMEDFIYSNDQISGIECYDYIEEDNFAIQGSYVINAAGPWVDDIRELDHSKEGKQLHITKGVHLVVGHEKLPAKQSIYFEIADGRMIFIIPRHITTYIGTTDTDYYENKDDLKVTRNDVEYLLNAVNTILPDIDLKIEDVESSWAGLRPLIQEEGKTASEISRKDEIFISDSGLISMAGGKLTGYRKMAAKVTDMVAEKMNDPTIGKCKTLDIPLTGNEFKSYAEVKEYVEEVSALLKKMQVSPEYAGYLVHNYGKQTDLILKDMEDQRIKDPDKKLLLSELYFTVNNEMVCNPLDFVERRTGRLYFLIRTVEKYSSEILEYFTEKFSWTDNQRKDAESRLVTAIQNARTFS